MQIEYKNNKIKKICTDVSAAKKLYGMRMAACIQQRIDEISAADSVETLVLYKIGRCHYLSQNRKGQYAMDLVHPYRLVFIVAEESIEIAKIIEIVDYH